MNRRIQDMQDSGKYQADKEIVHDVNGYDTHSSFSSSSEIPVGLHQEYPEEESQLLTTNRTIRLSCTLAALFSPFAFFLLFAEKESRAIRHNSLQSMVLGIFHLGIMMLCFCVSEATRFVPELVPFSSSVAWIIYVVTFVTVTAVRWKLMLSAWRGLRYDLPLLGWWLERFV